MVMYRRFKSFARQSLHWSLSCCEKRWLRIISSKWVTPPDWVKFARHDGWLFVESSSKSRISTICNV